MNSFLIWLESKKQDKYKDFILSYLSLDKDKGLSQNLDAFDKEDLLKRIKDSNVYAEISENARDKIENILTSDSSFTIGDLVRAMGV